MAYEVTATRRRPQSFDNLIGQEFVADTLKNSIQSGKIAHAYLFSGPRGCGKTSTARILAKALNCEKGMTATPCGECAACKAITAGSSLDVIEIDGASNTSVNDVRQIKDEILFPPNSCRYKIYIIDEVHMLSTPAFNALLKTIEEPPAYVIFIFATTELQKVPATIKSRCQQFNFRLVPIEKVKDQLAKAAEEIGVKAEEEALYWIARESTGSMRDAYTLFDQVTAFSDGEITYEKIRDKLGLVGVDRLNELFELCVKSDVSSALLKLDEYIQNGISFEQLISNCTDYLRSLLLIKSGVTKEALLGQSAERYSRNVLNAWNTIQIERGLDIFLTLYRDIRYSLSPRYEIELAISRLCWLSQYVSPSEVKKAIDAVRPMIGGLASKRVVPAAGAPSALSAATPAGTAPAVNASAVNTASRASDSSPVSAPSSTGGFKAHFSALDSESSAPAAGTSAEGANHPFSQGGAEPPVTKSAVSVAYDGKNDIDVTQDVSSSEGSAQDYGAAPEDEEVPEEVLISSAEKYLADEADKEKEEAEAKSAAHFTSFVQEGTKIDTSSMDEVKKAVVSEFSISDAMIASSLMKTKDWTFSNENGGETITAAIDVPYERVQLSQNAPKVSEILSKIYGHPVTFIVKLEEHNVQQVVVNYPPEVEILMKAFRGSVLGSN